MAWSGPNNRKQTDKARDKAAKVAQKWMQRGFTPEQVANGIRNKVGYITSAKDGKVQFYGFYNDEKSSAARMVREITATEIVSFP